MTVIATHRWLASASELYDELTFKTVDLYNEKAPDPWVSFTIGGILAGIGFGLWIRRLVLLRRKIKLFEGSVLFRAMISAAIDSDEPFYTITSFSAFSFICLGGLQLAYQETVTAMMIFYALSSSCDSIRVIVAYREAASLADVVLTSKMLGSKLRGDKMVTTTELAPGNVYEDFGRNATIVFMVFATQVILISFVATDIYESQTHTCPDGTGGCPVAGTVGSYGFYVLGIFMACVYLLGPKTNFGQSEQNPAYWLQLLLAAKTMGAKCTWYDAVADKERCQELSHSDWRIWVRFFMSFMINGVGFHILVHALPIQVASQSSLIGVVFRAVGMMYLVDLDDTPAEYTFQLAEKVKPDDAKPQTLGVMINTTKPTIQRPMSSLTVGGSIRQYHHHQQHPSSTSMSSKMDLTDVQVSAEAQRIVAEALEGARVKLEALARGEAVGSERPLGNSASNSARYRTASSRKLMSGALVLATANSTATMMATEQENPSGALEAVVESDDDDAMADEETGGPGGAPSAETVVSSPFAPYASNGTTNAVAGAEISLGGDIVEQTVAGGVAAPTGNAMSPDSAIVAPLAAITEMSSSERIVVEEEEQQEDQQNVAAAPLTAIAEMSPTERIAAEQEAQQQEEQQAEQQQAQSNVEEQQQARTDAGRQ